MPVTRETLPSFLSRFAIANGAPLADFCVDLGFRFKRFLACEDAPLARLAEAAGLSLDQLGELVSWTGRPVGEIRMAFRNEIFTSKAVRSPVIRCCMACLREDAQRDIQNPISMMALRGDWLVREVKVCCRHELPLIAMWESDTPLDRYDTAAQFRRTLAQITAGDIEQSHCPPSAYDMWLDARLESGADPTWLAGHGLFAATTICSLLGGVLTQNTSTKPHADGDTHHAGFAVLSQGQEALRTALKHHAERSSGKVVALRGTFGKLYDALSNYLTDEQFTPFKRILRECILETWPIAAGEMVLGEILPARILHTPATAAQEIGVGVSLVEQFLIEAGAIPEDDARPATLRTFDAAQHAGLLAEIPTLVGPLEMQEAIGATKSQLRSLQNDGILHPRISRPKINSPWRIADGQALLGELGRLAMTISPDDECWEEIQAASKRRRLRVGDIITAVRNGSLGLGRAPQIYGYRSFRVLKYEINALPQEKLPFRIQESSPQEGQLASAFARDIGMRSKGWFHTLFKAGHVSATWVQHPRTNVRRLYVSDADVTAFNQRFLTLTQMQAEFGLHRQTCAARLKAAGVAPFAPDGWDYGPLFERDKTESALRASRP